MGNDFSSCQHGLTQQCPEIASQIMAKILTLPPNDDIPLDTIETVNELCRNCASFDTKQ